MEAPKEWPREISESYDPIRVLGTGGFASVVLARQKSQQTANPAANTTNIPKKVAIKVVGGSEGNGNTQAASLYARREIELLQQIRHCGIVRLFDSWDRNSSNSDGDDEENKKSPQGASPTAGVLVLEYIKGPTVESLLKHGGALSTTFGRVIIAQVMDAISYLHYRAVLHRDIKPDNIIVTGALSSDDSIWDNKEDENVFSRDDKSPEEWKRLCLKYRAKIIDFGFARALTPSDMEENDAAPVTDKAHPKKKYSGYTNVQDAQKKKKTGLGKLFGSKSSLSQLDTSAHSIGSVGSVSHKMKRVMSTLGNRNYAAPEIVNKVRQFSAQDKKKEKQSTQEEQQKRISETTKTISSFVADYGLLVDSYSMGHTIRYMMTGVQPGCSIEDVIKKQQRSGMAKKVLSKFGLGSKKHKKEGTKKVPRKPRYRSLDDLPGQVFLLVDKLTEIYPQDRISIRKARRTIPWVDEVLSFQICSKSSSCDESKGPLLSLDHCSEEQLSSLHQTRYLPMATTTPGSVVSTHGEGAPTVTTIESQHDFPLDSSDCSSDRIAENTSNNNKTRQDNPNCTNMDRNDAIGLCFEDDMITF